MVKCVSVRSEVTHVHPAMAQVICSIGIVFNPALVFGGKTVTASAYWKKIKKNKKCVGARSDKNAKIARDGIKTEINACLNAKGKRFYAKAERIRASYSRRHPYKHFLLVNYRLAEMDPEGYFHRDPGPTGSAPNPKLYKNVPKKRPSKFFRYVKDCKTKITIQKQVLNTDTGYKNFVGRDRYQQQCLGDGTFDNYYVESLTKLE